MKEYRFNVEKDERKAFVAAVSEVTGLEAVYQYAPTLAYKIGGCTVDRHGTLTCEDSERDGLPVLLVALVERGYDYETQEMVGHEVADGDVTDDNSTLSIDMPLDGFTATAIGNLENLIASKAWIFRKMTGSGELPVERHDDRLGFPWFLADCPSETLEAYTSLIYRLCETAKAKKRVATKERQPEDGDNEKFKARCTLLMLGFIGSEYTQTRKILLAPFSGNGSFSKGDGKKAAVSSAIEEADTAAPLRCGGCFHHRYYSDGLLRTSAGDIVNTSGRALDKYTHYCVNAPSGFRKIKHACDWSGREAAPKWCPQYAAAAAATEGVDDTWTAAVAPDVNVCPVCGANIVRIDTASAASGNAVCNADAVSYWLSAQPDSCILTLNGDPVYCELTGKSEEAYGVGYTLHTCFEFEQQPKSAESADI